MSLWNGSSIAELNLETGKLGRWINLLHSTASADSASTDPGSHPTTLKLSPQEDTLYATLSNSDAVVSVDLRKIGKEDIDLKASDARDGSSFKLYALDPVSLNGRGSVPLALSLAPDGKHLFVAASSLDAIAVFAVAEHSQSGPAESVKPIGFIPTEWYPSALTIAGNDLIIATAKGEGSGPNNGQGNLKGERKRKEHPYIPTLIGGSLQRLSLAEIDKNLSSYTKQVEEDNLLRADAGKFEFAGGSNPIRHVIYVLKENRTYDQILGDLPVGDGDRSLTMYGEAITPNEHKLALQFGVLDNFYDSGEVSGDGHVWSTASTTSDYNEKTWPIAYRSKERTYDLGGSVAEEFPLEQGIPDVDDPATGFIWDNLARHGLTYRIYGEFIDAVWCEKWLSRGKRRRPASPKEGTLSPSLSNCPVTEIKKGASCPRTSGNPRGGPARGRGGFR